jgi:hypothetical protein
MLPALVAPRLAPSANLGLPQINRGDLIGANFEDFFVPSSRQPLYGAVVRSVYGVHVGERAAFFGYVLLILGLITAVRVFANFRAANPILRFAALAVPLGWLMSLPAEPKIFGRTVPLPDAAFVIGTFTSWWRIYSRFILLAGLGLSILSAYALTRLLGSPRASSRYLAYALAGLIVLEALPGLPPPTSRLRVDGLTRWLAEHPGGSVATYPLAAGVTTPRDWGKIYWGSYYLQIYHRHPIFAAVDPSMVYPSILGLTQALVGDLSNNRTPGMLRTAGVRWVILRLPLYRASHQRVPRIPRGLRPVASFPGARVYEVVAPPLDLAELVNEHPKRLARAFAIADPPLSFGRGFYAPEAFNGYIAARWMRQDAKLRVRPLVPRPFVKYLVSMQVLSAGGARKLTVLDGSRVVGTFDVQTFDLPFRFRTTFPGIDSTLTFHVDPGPQQISESDRRVVSVLVESVRISPVGLHLKAEPSSGPK